MNGVVSQTVACVLTLHHAFGTVSVQIVCRHVFGCKLWPSVCQVLAFRSSKGRAKVAEVHFFLPHDPLMALLDMRSSDLSRSLFHDISTAVEVKVGNGRGRADVVSKGREGV